MTTILIFVVCAAIILGVTIFFMAKLESETKITLQKVKKDTIVNQFQHQTDEELAKEMEKLDEVQDKVPVTAVPDNNITTEAPKKKRKYKKKPVKKD
jgi:hypothetical protein